MGQRLGGGGGEMGINDPDVAKTRGTCYCFSVLLYFLGGFHLALCFKLPPELLIF